LWSETYERESGEALALESVIAGRIARTMGSELLAAARISGDFPWSPARALDLRDRQQGIPPHLATANSQAFESYLCGLQSLSLRNEEGFREALRCFRRAIQEDPHYALAYTGLADTYNLLGEYYLLPPAEAFPRAEEAARHALDIDGSLAEAHTSLAFATAKYEWDWPAAETGFRRALELNPEYATAHQWYAELLSGMGRHEQAIAEIAAARRLDPLSPIIQSVEGFIFYNARRYDQAITVCRATLARNPHFLPALHFLLLASERKGGQESRDIAALRRTYNEALHNGPRSVSFKSLLEVRPQFEPAPYSVAAGYASLGRKEQAFAWLDRAYERKDALLAFAKVDPNLDSLRGDPRFAELLRRVGLE
jgi:tetratricopeptide (TPR) repeat protein